MLEGDFFSWKKDLLLLNIILQPSAKKDEIIGVFDHQLKIKIKAPPVEGKANEYAVKFLANFFDIPRSSVELIRGHQSKRKVFSIHCKNKKAIGEKIKKLHK